MAVFLKCPSAVLRPQMTSLCEPRLVDRVVMCFWALAVHDLEVHARSAVYQMTQWGPVMSLHGASSLEILTKPTLRRPLLLLILKRQGPSSARFPRGGLSREPPLPSRRWARTLRPAGGRLSVTKGVESLVCTDWIPPSFSGSRIPEKVFPPSPADHENYDAEPRPLHKLHTITRIKSTRRPECGKDTMKTLE